MKVIRTFHPVGQGAFYTEVFFEADIRQFVMVYDCGTETAVDAMAVSLDDQIQNFKKSLGNNPKIDLLFISHFHDDHISGITELLDGVKVVKTIIPMLNWPALTVTRVRNYLRLYSNNAELADDIDQVIVDLYLNRSQNGKYGEVEIVSPNTDDYPSLDEQTEGGIVSNRRKIVSGGRLLGYKRIWEYIPFNSIEFNNQHAIDLLNGLMQLAGVKKPEDLDISSLVRTRLDEVQKEYRKAMNNNRSDNLYTLVVGSQPVDDIIVKPCPRLSHCIYFGDFDSKNNQVLWSRLNNVIEYHNMGTVQVPHHGAKVNWRTEMGIGDPRHYVVSTGTTNGYHHPNYWVIEEIWERGHRPYVISEKWEEGLVYKFELFEL